MRNLFHQVLLVEDDTVATFINEQLLVDMQVADEVHAVSNAAQALGFINQHWIAHQEQETMGKLLLLDIRLQDMDGFELLAQLAKFSPIQNLCIAILTASSHVRDMEKAEKFNVDAFIEKPLTKDKLEAIVEKLKACAA